MPQKMMKRPAPALRETDSAETRAQAIVAELEGLGSKTARDGMERFGIFVDRAFGIPMNQMQKVAKRFGKEEPAARHALAAALWDTGWYEARIVAAYVDVPALVTPAQMDRWCRDFDNWGIVDTVCFVLFDRTPYAFDKVAKWSNAKGEFQRRAAFALLACVALHDKKAPESEFVRLLPLAEAGADDDRNFVKKGVVWALRGVGGRSPKLTKLVLQLATRLAGSTDATPRWVGKTVLREMTKGRRETL
jgi:3-methyladenine DNA glycosylase AlkD